MGILQMENRLHLPEIDLTDETDLASGALVTLKKGEGRLLKQGGAWVFDNEIASVDGTFDNGDIVAVHDFDGFMMGYGFINTASRIRVRMLTRGHEETVSNALIQSRVQAAWEYRKKVIDTASCRVIFGEADFLPGITIDKYEDVLVIESLALGSDRLKGLILYALCAALSDDGIQVRGIYERSDAAVRRKEGMEPYKGFLSEPFDTNVQISENGVQYLVDVANGQKTGFFLDQKLNRLAVQKISAGARVLDCFTHTGSFALNAAVAGAAHVDAVDASATAIEQARKNAALNGLSDEISFVCADAFEFLRTKQVQVSAAGGAPYDVVILDPPAFTKSRDSVKAAVKGYREINLQGMKLVKDRGFFVTASCSHFMTQELFSKTIAQAAQAAHVRLRQVEFRTQAPDHPILWSGDDNSYYLKFYIFQLVRTHR